MSLTMEEKVLRDAVDTDPMDALSWHALADAHEEVGATDASRIARQIAVCVQDGKVASPGRQGKKIIADIKRLIGTRSRKVRIVVTLETIAHDVRWGGGSRNTYRSLEFSPVRYTSWRELRDIGEGNHIAVMLHGMIVKHSVFCGQDIGITIYVQPRDCLAFVN